MTAYAVPERSAHGNYPRASRMNKFSDGLNHIHEIVASQAVRIAVPIETDADFCLQHKHRWLHYKSSGAVEDLAQTETNSLTFDDDDWTAVFDLDTVDWLAYGDAYLVTGVTFAEEDVNP